MRIARYPGARTLSILALTAVLLGLPTQILGQAPKKLPDPENVSINSAGGLLLACTYYGSNLGKKAVPIVLLHGETGNRIQYDAFATYLQNLGFAVMTVDLRGCGGSTTTIGGQEVSKLGGMGRLELNAIYQHDLPNVKRFLLKKNDNEELNIDALGVVACDISSVFAGFWILRDWSFPDLPGRRQGKDIKALVMLSPDDSFKGVAMTRYWQAPAMNAQSILIVVGEEERSALASANKIYDTLRRAHPEAPADQRQTDETLFLVKRATRLQGMSLLDPKLKLGVDQVIATFLKWRLSDRLEHFNWTMRGNPG